MASDGAPITPLHSTSSEIPSPRKEVAFSVRSYPVVPTLYILYTCLLEYLLHPTVTQRQCFYLQGIDTSPSLYTACVGGDS